jgi:hypothetical protein
LQGTTDPLTGDLVVVNPTFLSGQPPAVNSFPTGDYAPITRDGVTEVLTPVGDGTYTGELVTYVSALIAAAGGYLAELTTTSTISNTTTETTAWTPANVAAALLAAGVSVFRLRVGGTFDNIATSGTYTVKVKVGGTTIVSMPIAVSQNNAATNTPWYADFDLYVDTTGALAQVTATGLFCVYTASGGVNPRPVSQTQGGVNLSGGFQLTVTGQMGTANAGNILRTMRGTLQQIA